MNNISVYVTVLHDSLQKKLDILKQLLELTKEQSNILGSQDPEIDRFDDAVEQKMQLLEKLQELDEGFDNLYKNIGNEIKDNKNLYQVQIVEMQNYIRGITQCGIEIEGLEKRNKDLFQRFLVQKRQEIRNFKVSNKTASSYHQNMVDQHHEWQTYFVDEKK